MDDFMSRDTVEQFICEACERSGCPKLWGNDCEIICRLNKIPSADVRPVQYGRWIELENPNYSTFDPTSREYDLLCSNCGAKHYGKEKNFCPNCGADMREVVLND